MSMPDLVPVDADWGDMLHWLASRSQSNEVRGRRLRRATPSEVALLGVTVPPNAEPWVYSVLVNRDGRDWKECTLFLVERRGLDFNFARNAHIGQDLAELLLHRKMAVRLPRRTFVDGKPMSDA